MRSGAKALPARGTGRGVVMAVLALVLVLASSAAGAQTRRYTGTSFGPDGVGGTESFVGLQSIAVDQAKGFVYAYDGAAGKIYKFDTSGNPVPVGSGPGNVIEGVGGTGGGAENQIAVAPPGSPGETSGDIYAATNSTVKVFSEAGVELGLLGEGETCGVAVSPSGHLLIGSFSKTLREYVPTENPPTDSDLVATGTVSASLCNVAADGLNSVYATSYVGSEIAKLEGIGDTQPTLIKPGAQTIFADPETDYLYANRGEAVAVYGPEGAKIGLFGSGELTGSHGVAVDDSTEKAYVSDGGGKIKVFGPPLVVPDTQTGAATEVLPNRATLDGTVSPEGFPLDRCFFEYGETGFEKEAECVAPKAAEVSSTGEDVPVHAPIKNLKPSTTYQFRLLTENANGISEGETVTVTTPSTVITEPASVSAESVILKGKVFPAGAGVSACKFEYGLTSHPGFEGSRGCNPAVGSIPASNQFDAVTAKLTGLQKEATYRFRLVGTTVEGVATGETLGFETFGKPGITQPRASNADQSSVTLEATINPRGSATTYSFDWGPTADYGQVAPVESEAPYGAFGRIVIKARLTGLTPATNYHFSVVANNAGGTSQSSDAELETLDSCGLPDGRCFEVVSERDSGPVAIPEEPAGRIELHFQSSTQPGDFAYVVESGFPDATKGSEVLYRALRSPSGWTSHQLSAPLLAQNQTRGGTAHSSSYRALSETLSCGVLISNQPLTDDASTRYATEVGGTNLYRDNMNGSYTAITNLPPENPEEVEDDELSIGVSGISSNCSKVIFNTVYKYASVPTIGNNPSYEWEEGKLRSLGFVPGPRGGEVPVEASAIDDGVSADGSRVLFTAQREASTNPQEIGRQGLFVRENGKTTRDISLSHTSTPDESPEFQFASKDGSRVFFLANAGLTTDSSSEGKDLYEYDITSDTLTDRSVDKRPGGAEVAGLIGGSEDGSRIYFVARGELVSGQGRSYAENKLDNTYSVYTEVGGKPAYVASILATYPRVTSQGNPDEENLVQRVIAGSDQTAQVSPDGRFLLFESGEPLTGYEAGNGITEVYLFDADASSESVVCVSCRPDGKPTVQPRGDRFLVERSEGNSLVAPRTLAVRNGTPEVSFTSFDALAPGAVDGAATIYEWAHDQIYRLTTEAPGLESEEHYEGHASVAVKNQSASADGTDFYFADTQRLLPEDADERYSIYDARVGGGFPQPTAPAGPCNPAVENSCQGAEAPPSAAAPASPTASFNGPGNVKPKKNHKKKHRRKKHHSKNRHRSTKKHRHGRDGNVKHATSDRRHGA